MILKILKGYQPFLLILLPVAGVFLWLSAFHPGKVDLDDNYLFMPLSAVVLNAIGYNSLVSKIFAYALVLLNAFLISQLNIRFNFLRTRTYLPAVIYLLLISAFSELQRLTPALLSSVLVIWALNKLMSTFKKEGIAIQIMDASLIISIASMFYFPAVFFITILWAGLIILRPFRAKEWVFTLMGIVLPYAIGVCILYISGKEISFPFHKLYDYPFIENINLANKQIYKIYMVYLAILIIISSIQMVRLFSTKKVHSRRYFIFFLWLFIITALMYMIIPSVSVEIYFINAFAVSFLFSHFFVNLRSGWIPETLFLLLIVFAIAGKII